MSVALRAQAFAILEENISVSHITEVTELSKATIYHIKRITYKRGYDPAVSRVFKDEYFIDAPRSGRPKVTTEKIEEEILTMVCSSHSGREKTSQELGFATGISSMSAWRVLRSHGLRKWKPTWKPGLTQAMRDA